MGFRLSVNPSLLISLFQIILETSHCPLAGLDFFAHIVPPVFNSHRMLINLDSLDLILDPNLMLNPASFLLSVISWASVPSSSNTPEENLNRFIVRTIMHNKQSETPENELFVFDFWDTVTSESKVLVLDRIYDDKKEPVSADPVVLDFEARKDKIMARITTFVTALKSLLSTPSSPFTPSMDHLTIGDKVSLSLTESADLVLDTLNLANETKACDRWLGIRHIRLPSRNGHTVRTTRPIDFTLFDLAIVAHVAHELHPRYSLLKDSCFFYAALVFSVIDNRWSRQSSEVDNGRNLNVAVGSPCRCGGWYGFKVKRIEEKEVSDVLTAYDLLYPEFRNQY